MDDCEYSIQIITVPAKVCKLGPILQINKLLLEEILKPGMTGSSPIKINTEPFKKWITAILSVTKTDTLLKGWMAAIRVVK